MYSQTNKKNYAGFNPVFGQYNLAPYGSVRMGKAIGCIIPTPQLGNTDKVVVSFDTETESVTKIVKAYHLSPVVEQTNFVRIKTSLDEFERDNRKGKKADNNEIRVEIIQRAKKPLRG